MKNKIAVVLGIIGYFVFCAAFFVMDISIAALCLGGGAIIIIIAAIIFSVRNLK